MGLVWNLLVMAVLGLFAGAVARFLVPGRQSMGLLATMILGIVGSFVGGFLGNLIFGGEFVLSASGIIGSIIGAIVVLLIYIFATKKSA